MAGVDDSPEMLMYWLNSLDVPSALLANSVEDLRDGTVLTDVITLIKNSSPEEAARGDPKNLQDALNWLGERIGWASLPAELARPGAARAILAGDIESALAVLRFLRRFDRSYDDVLPASPVPSSTAPTGAGPAQAAVGPSEGSAPEPSSPMLSPKQQRLVSWIRSLGVLPQSHLQDDDSPFMWSRIVKDGTFLCRLVAAVERRGGGSRNRVVTERTGTLTLRGVIAHPKTSAAMTRNVSVALSVLRENATMPSKHLWSTDKLRSGDNSTCWGLLLDIKKCYSSKQQRPTMRPKAPPKETRHAALPLPPSKAGARARVDTTAGSTAGDAATSARVGTADSQRNVAETTKGIAPVSADPVASDSARTGASGAHSESPTDSLVTDNGLQSTGPRVTGSVGIAAQSIPASPHEFVSLAGRHGMVDGHGLRVSRMIDPLFTLSSKGMKHLRSGNSADSRSRAAAPQPKMTTAEVEFKVPSPEYVLAVKPSSSSDKCAKGSGGDHQIAPAQAKAVADATVLAWAQKLGIQLLPRNQEPTRRAVAEALRDGVALCRLVATVEARTGGGRGVLIPDTAGKLTLRGVSANPRTAAAMNRNVNVSLSLLQENPDMSQRYVWAVDDIRSANTVACWGLLRDLYDCYAPKLAAPGSSRRRSTEAALTDVEASKPAEELVSHPSQSVTTRGLGTTPRPPSRPMRPIVRHAGIGATAGAVGTSSSATAPVELGGSSHAAKSQHISEDQRSLLRSWLQSLGLNFPRQLGTHVLESPMFNGVLLCELARVLCPAAGKIKYTRSPRTVSESRNNVNAALSVLRSGQGLGRPVPSSLLWATEPIIQGRADAFWGLLWHLREAFPGAAAAPGSRVVDFAVAARGPSGGSMQSVVPEPRVPELPYDVRQRWRVERSILSWLYSIGAGAGDTGDSGAPNDLEEVQHQLEDGTLLCKIVHLLGGNVLGPSKRPRTAATKLQNLSKACEALRRVPRMSHEFTYSLSALTAGDRTCWLGLLEDCHRCYDGVAPATSVVHSGTTVRRATRTPYFGSHVPPARPPPPIPPAVAMARPPMHQDRQDGAPSGIDVSDIVPEAPVPALARLAAPTEMDPLFQTAAHEPGFKRDVFRVDLAQPAEQPTPEAPRMPSRSGQPESDLVLVDGAATASGSIEILARSVHGSKMLRRADEPHDSSGGALEFPPPADVAPGVFPGSPLVQWLHSIGVTLRDPEALQGSHVPEFGDGLVLCRIVEQVEHMRGNIAGVERVPKAPAARLQNIRRALEVLRDKKTMPMDYLWSELAIRAGDATVIVPLLRQIRRAYGHHFHG